MFIYLNVSKVLQCEQAKATVKNITIIIYMTYILSYPVFQLGLFMRALCPARIGLRPARVTHSLPELYIKKLI